MREGIEAFLQQLVESGRLEHAPCEHAQQIQVVSPSVTAGCEECLKSGGRWVHLRMCLTCGKVGCCDNSPNRHARKHAEESGHEVIMSFEPGESWIYCFADDLVLPRR